MVAGITQAQPLPVGKSTLVQQITGELGIAVRYASADEPALLRRLFELARRYSGQILSYTKMLGQLQDAGNTTLRVGACRRTGSLISGGTPRQTHDRAPRPFGCTKTADQILESLKRFCMRTSNSGHRDPIERQGAPEIEVASRCAIVVSGRTSLGCFRVRRLASPA